MIQFSRLVQPANICLISVWLYLIVELKIRLSTQFCNNRLKIQLLLLLRCPLTNSMAFFGQSHLTSVGVELNQIAKGGKLKWCRMQPRAFLPSHKPPFWIVAMCRRILNLSENSRLMLCKLHFFPLLKEQRIDRECSDTESTTAEEGEKDRHLK